MSNKQLILSSGDGLAVPAGGVGEIIGSETSFVGVSTYFNKTNTQASSGGQILASITLNKGVYLLGFDVLQLRENYVFNEQLDVYVLAPSGVIYWTASQHSAVPLGTLRVSASFPIRVTQQGLTISLQGSMSDGDSSYGDNRIYAIRIA